MVKLDMANESISIMKNWLKVKKFELTCEQDH